ncbi:MAG: diaminopimelate epimerase, partial [Pseudomonadota bacterium]
MLEFFKFEALGNDFMLVDAREQSFEPTSEKVRHLGDRRTGIGFDQLLILRPSEEATVQVDIHNQDGSVAEQCGNGMRAVALYLHEQGELVETASLATAGGQVQIEFETPDRITATLPPPAFAPPPGSPAARNENWTESHGGRNLGLNFVALGNPHLITELTDSADDLFFTAAGSTLSRHALLADGANVSFARVIDRSHVDLTVYERGVGLTRA